MTNSTWNRTPVILTTCAAGLTLVGALIAWVRQPDSAPRLNADTVTLATFVSTDEYLKLPFDKQSLYMKVLEDREDNDELKRAFSAGKLSEAAYRAAIQEAWLGEQLKRSEKFAVLAPGSARTRYIAEILDNKQSKSKRPDKESSKPRLSEDVADDANDPSAIKRDPSATKMRMDSWPATVREQVEAYRQAYDDAKQAREAAAKPQPTPSGAKQAEEAGA